MVQWALSDSVSPIFKNNPCDHKERQIQFSFSQDQKLSSFKVMNFNADEAIKEYFVDHLKMKLLYSVIIQNKHVQKLIHAAPGISELFFLGRLFWLIELAQVEKGVSFDRIIVDSPATGHGVSLFSIAKTVANLGMTGPLALECERVAKLLGNPQKTSVFLVTLPEELPVEECLETVDKIEQKLGYGPQYILINQSVNERFYPELKNVLAEKWFQELISSLQMPTAQYELESFVEALLKRNLYEAKCAEFAKEKNIPFISIPDFNLTQKQNSPYEVIVSMSKFFKNLEKK